MNNFTNELLNCDQISGLLHLGYPNDYYKGTLPYSFTIPRNILIWLDTNEVSRTGISFHYRYLLVFPIKVGGKAIIDKNVVDIHENNGMLIFPFQFHHFIFDYGDRQWLFIGFELNDIPALDHLKGETFFLQPNVKKLIEQLIEGYLLDRKSQLFHNRTPLILAQLMNEIILFTNSLANGRKKGSAFTNSLATIESKIHREICSNLNLSTEELGKKLGYSGSRLRAIYKSAYGISIGKVVRKIKFSKAEALLVSTNKKIDDIASTCGFGSLYAFSLAFKKRHGISPRAYRSKMQTTIL
jgi:AraC-like DNA-binding protein